MANTHCMTDTGLAESIMRKEIGHAASTLHTHHQASLTVSLYSMLVLSLRLCIGPACEIGLSTGTWRGTCHLVKERKKAILVDIPSLSVYFQVQIRNLPLRRSCDVMNELLPDHAVCRCQASREMAAVDSVSQHHATCELDTMSGRNVKIVLS